MMPLLLTGSADRCIKVWDPRKGNPIEPSILVQTLYKHTGTVTALVACGDHIVSGSVDRTVRLWKAVDGCRALMYPPLEQVKLLLHSHCPSLGANFSHELWGQGNDLLELRLLCGSSITQLHTLDLQKVAKCRAYER